MIRSVVETFIPYHGEEVQLVQRAHLEAHLERLVAIESQPIRVGNLFKTISNTLLSFSDRSDWRTIKQTLKCHAMQVITDHFDRMEPHATLIWKADALAEFILRYLVSLKGPRMLIDQAEWNREQIATLPVTDLIERAIHGYGRHLPKHKVVDLLQLILLQKLDGESAVAKLEASFKTENKEVFKQAALMFKEYQAYLQSLDWVNGMTPSSYPGTQEKLVEHLNFVREKRAFFRTVEGFLNKADPQSFAQFGRLRLDLYLNVLEDILIRNPEPTYALSESIVDEVYTPDSLSQFIQQNRRVYANTAWVESGTHAPERLQATVETLFAAIAHLEKKIIDTNKELAKGTFHAELI